MYRGLLLGLHGLSGYYKADVAVGDARCAPVGRQNLHVGTWTAVRMVGKSHLASKFISFQWRNPGETP